MELEFRIFHHVFCEAYMIQRKAIEFDEYVRISYEKYLLGLVTISPTSNNNCTIIVIMYYFHYFIGWLILCSFLLLNYIRYLINGVLFYSNIGLCYIYRVVLHLNPESCQHQFTGKSVTEALKEHKACALQNSVELFAIAGAFLLVITVVLYFISRYYVRKLMSLKGINSPDDFILYLEVMIEVYSFVI